jgi:hypothetical protein
VHQLAKRCRLTPQVSGDQALITSRQDYNSNYRLRRASKSGG